jgi:hypothetical protein
MKMHLASLSALAALAALSASMAQAAAPPCRDNSSACLTRIGRMYVDALVSHDGSKLPLAPNVRRTENALTNSKGADEVRESFARTNMVKAARDVRSYADEKKGEVIFYFVIDVDLAAADVSADGTTKAGATDYKTAVTKPPGAYTVHEAERFKIVKGMITEIEIIAHVEDGMGHGSGWPIPRDAAVKK